METERNNNVCLIFYNIFFLSDGGLFFIFIQPTMYNRLGLIDSTETWNFDTIIMNNPTRSDNDDVVIRHLMAIFVYSNGYWLPSGVVSRYLNTSP